MSLRRTQRCRVHPQTRHTTNPLSAPNRIKCSGPRGTSRSVAPRRWCAARHRSVLGCSFAKKKRQQLFSIWPCVVWLFGGTIGSNNNLCHQVELAIFRISAGRRQALSLFDRLSPSTLPVRHTPRRTLRATATDCPCRVTSRLSRQLSGTYLTTKP